MAENLPYMKFFPADYLADCDVLSVGARGAWHTFLCKAWLARCASVSLKPAQWSRVFGASNVEQAERLIAEIDECEVGDVIREDDGRVTLISRRIERDLEQMGATQKKRSAAARIAAETRWNAERMPNACETHSKGNANAMRNDAILEARSQKLEAREDTMSSCELDEAKKILKYLNEKAGRQYRCVPAHLDAIRSRLKESGVTTEGIKAMIDAKCGEWLDNPEMAQYLRPQTLFNRSKFASYYDSRNQSSATTGKGYGTEGKF